MKKSMLFAAAAVVAMASCTNEDFTGFQQGQNGESAINFGSGTKKLTRGGQLTGEDAAKALGQNFVVLGVKGDAKMSASSISVFDYYNVNWKENTAGTTESNSSNWEYVNQEVNGLSSLATQTIKYWDFAKKQYDFIAFSRGKNEDKTIDQLFTTVKLENLGTASPAYTVMGTLDELKECYIADLKTVYNPSEATTGDLANEPTYTKGAVTPLFRRLQSKIRVAFYETVPGYSVKDVKFYKDAATTTNSGTTPYLYADGEKLAVGGTAEGLMEVSFPTIGRDSVKSSDYNKASIKFSTLSGTSALSKEIEFKKAGADIALSYTTKEKDEKTGTAFLGRSSNNATYIGENTEANDYAYVAVLPTGEGNVLNLKVDYTLESIDGSGEEINVVGATAVVPAIYTEWQPNYAYTYIFKISDQTNGRTNPDLGYVGLYPITFDAVVEGDIDGIQETITEVGEPSITTYQKGKVVTVKDEYKAGTDPIYITVDNGVKLTKQFYVAGATNIYTATLVDASGACQTISEQAVANCVLKNFNPASVAGPYSVIDKNGQTLTLTKADGWTLETTIDKADAPHGVTISTNGTDSCVAKIASPAVGTYVFQYMKTAATYTTPELNTFAYGQTYYEVVKSENVEAYTEVTATGTETYEANKYIKSLPVVEDANKLSDATMETGIVYFEKSTRGTSPNEVTVYTKKTSDGKETYTSDLRYSATLKSATGTLPKNTKYYVKEGNTENYIERFVTDDAGLNVKSSDPYYVIEETDFTEIASNTYVYLEAGKKCYAWNATELKLTTIEKTTGKEKTADTYYSAVTAAVYYDDTNKSSAFNTIATGTVCFTNTDATDSAPKAETPATGDETTVSGKVVATKPTYYYKVIKVVE